MKKILFAIVVISLVACQPKLNYPVDSENSKNLNSLLTLKVDTNIIFLQDFILHPVDIDSITSSSEKLTCILDNSKLTATVLVQKGMEHFVDIKLWIKGVPYSVPCRKSNKVDYIFTFNPNGKSFNKIQIAGQMNDWTPSKTGDLILNSAGVYEANLHLSPGTYLYQLVYDGEQSHDITNPNKVDNGYGKFNSILEIKENESALPKIYTDKINYSTVTLHVDGDVDEVFAYWQNFLIPSKYSILKSGELMISIPSEAEKMDRSFLRVWVSNKAGVSNDVLIPLQNGKVLTESAQITRDDKQAQLIYFVLVDRFMNGNKTNDQPMNRPDVNYKVDYWGGDLAGITNKIKDGYFDKLGFNTLWISPLNQNPTQPYGYYAPTNTKFSGYHGYWPISSSKVDFRFGTNNDFKSLVTDAHKKNMNVLLDYVAHHVHIEHPFYKQHPEWTTSLYLPDGTMNTERWDEHRLTTWFDTFMPTLDMSNPKVVQMMTDTAMFWLNEFKLDGFRHDACKHVYEQFWRELTLKIKKQHNGKNLYQIGETYGSPELINSYLTSGMLDGQFDFNLYDVANTTFAGVAGSNLTQVQGILNASLYNYGAHNLMGNISGNHDKPRFMAYASGDLKFGEDSKLAGWKRNIGISDSTAYDKLLLMHTLNLTIPGVPVVYYGDEIGLTGANDPDCRRMMKFSNLNNREAKLWNGVSVLAHLRKNNPVFIYGDFINIKTTTETWVYARKYFDNEAIVLFNNSNKTIKLEVELPKSIKSTTFTSVFQNEMTIEKNTISVELRPFSSDVLMNSEQIFTEIKPIK